MTRLHLPAGTAAADGWDVVVTPESAGWGFSSLRTFTLGPGAARDVSTGGEEMFVVPLSGGAVVVADGEEVELAGRADVFTGPTDVLYLAVGTDATVTSAAGGRFALAGARTDVVLPLRHVALADVPVEERGAGSASRQVRNFGAADVFEAGRLIAVEVVTPSGNWSSYPAHKHDETSATESCLEEVYYYEIGAGPDGQPGFGFHQTSPSRDGGTETLVQVRDRDTVLVPDGWHGPCVAAPGHDMYYLNVMAGPDDDRAWRISDHPDQTWVRDTWTDAEVDPRVRVEAGPR